MLMLEDGDHIVEPGEETEDDIDWESMCPGGQLNHEKIY